MNRDRGIGHKVISIIAILLLFIVFIIFPTQSTSAITYITSPLFSIADSIKTGSAHIVSTIFVRKSNLIEENTFIKKQNERLIEQINLSEEQIFINNDTEGFVVASVLLAPPHTRFDTYRIGSGIEDNIEIGDFVYSLEGYIIGFIESVGDNFGTVLLFSSAIVDTSVSINDFTTIAKGIGGGGLLIEVPKNIELEINDFIFHQESNSSYFAKVVKIEDVASDPIKKVFGQLVTNPNTISEVLIDISNNNN